MGSEGSIENGLARKSNVTNGLARKKRDSVTSAENLEIDIKYQQLCNRLYNSDGEDDANLIIDGLKQLANSGYLQAQKKVALSYIEERYVKKDLQEAFKYYLLAANQGDTEAERYIAKAYLYAQGCMADTQKALHFYRNLIAKDDKDSVQDILGFYNKISYEYFKKWLEELETDTNSHVLSFVSMMYQHMEQTRKYVDFFEKNNDFQNASECMRIAQLFMEGADGIFYDKNEAKKWYDRALETNDPEILFTLGTQKYISEQYECNYLNEAIQALRKAMELGHYDASYELGKLYHKIGDKNNALSCYQNALSLNNEKVILKLGECYLNGDIVNSDYVKAFNFFSNVSEEDIPKANFYLARMYEYGCGVQQNFDKAQKLYAASAERGCVEAQHYMAELMKCMNAHKDSMEWYSKAAESQNGSVEAVVDCYEAYYSYGKKHCKIGVADNKCFQMYIDIYNQCCYRKTEKGISLLNRIWNLLLEGEADNPKKQAALALIFYEGLGVQTDFKRAFDLANKSIQKGGDSFGHARYVMGASYRDGVVVPKDIHNAILWFKQGIELGSGYAYNAMGKMYMDGIGVEIDHVKGFEHILEAAQKGVQSACLDVGFMLQQGIGTTKNVKIAEQWYKYAYLCGSLKAKEVLKDFGWT